MNPENEKIVFKLKELLNGELFQLYRSSRPEIELFATKLNKMLIQLAAKKNNAEALSLTAIKTILETITFVFGCKCYYAEIASQRALTQEEKRIGKELINCLEVAQNLLQSLRDRGEK